MNQKDKEVTLGDSLSRIILKLAYKLYEKQIVEYANDIIVAG